MIDILIRYLGIKTKLLENIDAVISSELESGCILDLFSGSTVVSQKMMDRYTVYTNDIQKYSYIVSKATLEVDANFDYTVISVDKILGSSFFADNMKHLRNVWSKPLHYESCLLKQLKNDPDNYEKLIEFKSYYESAPYVFNYDPEQVPRYFDGMDEVYSIANYNNLKNAKSNYYYMLFTLNYAMPYFSLEQAMFVDSYRYAIDKMYENEEIAETEYFVQLSLLIYLLNNIVTSVGDHFAQPQQFKISDEKRLQKEIIKIIGKKTLDVVACLKDKCAEFNQIKPKSIFTNNKSFCDDYKNILKKNEIMKNVDLVYIDPPYTNAHYSRFYHILETLVNYDYPELEFFGRYRNDRFQSSFCIKSEATQEFEYMIGTCAEAKKIILISYSDTKQCIVSKEQLLDICKKYYKQVSVMEHDYLYRNFGQKPNKVKGNELLIVCR